MVLSKKPPQVNSAILLGLALELNAPLQSVTKSTQKLIEEYKTRDFEYVSFKDFVKIIKTLEQINRQLQHCCSVTTRINTLKRSKTDGIGSCTLNGVINEVVGLLKQQMLAAKIKVSLRLDKNIPLVRMDKIDCYQVIHNVLVNGMQAMPAGGTLRVRTMANKSKGIVSLEIQDEGVGISPEHLSNVFEPFFTTKERGFEKSSGLGLWVVYAIIEKAGGSIHIQSSLRKGTAVHINLPANAVLKSS